MARQTDSDHTAETGQGGRDSGENQGSIEGVGKQIAERRKQSFLTRYAPTLRPAPGARALVERMRGDGLRLVAASSAQSDELAVLLKSAQVDDLLDERVTASNVKESKPASDVVAVALEKFSLPPERVIVLGDTPDDIESASKIGVRTLALRCGGFDDSQLAGVIAIYNDPADLLAHYDTSPLSGDSIR